MHIATIILIGSLLVFDSFGASPDDPQALTNLRASYAKARTAATSPIDKKYVEALGTMKLQLTKAGDLRGALAVEAEIAAIVALQDQSSSSVMAPKQLSAFKTTEAFLAWLATTEWSTTAGAIYTFRDGQMTESNHGKVTSRPFTVIEVGKITWDWKPAENAILTFDRRLATATHKTSNSSYSLSLVEAKK